MRIFSGGLFLLLMMAAVTASAADRPNILFILADDLAYDAVGVLGNEEVETPHLDQLAREGVSFTRAYNMGAWGGAVCVASRTMLNTGRFLWRAHASRADEFIPQKRMWSQLMATAGYDTYFTGKWHNLGHPDQVFSTVRHVRGGMPQQSEEGYNRPLGPDDHRWLPWKREFGGFWEGGRHWSEIVADDAEAFLQRARQSEAPFFMYVAFNAPHDPRQAPREFVERYRLDRIALPQPFLRQYPYDIGSNRGRDELLAPFPRTQYAVRVNRQEYYAIITHMDQQIGRILEALAASGMSDNTYVVFTADHGLAVGHHGLMGKQNMYEHSMRVPFFVTGPGIPAGKQLDAPIYLQDVMPTTLEWAGVSPPQHVEFRSILPLLRGEREKSYDAIYGAYTETQRMILAGDHKLIVYPQIGKKLLYDLRLDPFETFDLAADPQHAARVEDLTQQLAQLQIQMDDELALQPATPQ